MRTFCNIYADVYKSKMIKKQRVQNKESELCEKKQQQQLETIQKFFKFLVDKLTGEHPHSGRLLSKTKE